MTLITSESAEWLTYIDNLQRRNADDLAFYPLATLEKAMASGHVIQYQENAQPGGYLWFGAVRPGFDVIIYQACIDYDLRRQHHGFSLVAQLSQVGRAGGATGIRLKCASSAESNRFWGAAGFYVTDVRAGGIKRGRDINCYRSDLVPALLQPPSIEASTKPIDLTAYNKMKRDGVPMPSRFSRTHYGGRVSLPDISGG